jgi:hypothetical protein
VTVVDVLRAQHERVDELFGRVSSPDEDRAVVLRELLRELAAHVATERSVLDGVVGSRVGSAEAASRMGEDHRRMSKLMVLIERRKFNSPDVPDLLNDLRGVLDGHLDLLDGEVFPALQSDLDAGELDDLGRRAEQAGEMVTTHPHPHLLSLGPLADRLTSWASRWDALRDRTVTNVPSSHPDDGPPGQSEGRKP